MLPSRACLERWGHPRGLLGQKGLGSTFRAQLSRCLHLCSAPHELAVTGHTPPLPSPPGTGRGASDLLPLCQAQCPLKQVCCANPTKPKTKHSAATRGLCQRLNRHRGAHQGESCRQPHTWLNFPPRSRAGTPSCAAAHRCGEGRWGLPHLTQLSALSPSCISQM